VVRVLDYYTRGHWLESRSEQFFPKYFYFFNGSKKFKDLKNIFKILKKSFSESSLKIVFKCFHINLKKFFKSFLWV